MYLTQDSLRLKNCNVLFSMIALPPPPQKKKNYRFDGEDRGDTTISSGIPHAWRPEEAVRIVASSAVGAREPKPRENIPLSSSRSLSRSRERVGRRQRKHRQHGQLMGYTDDSDERSKSRSPRARARAPTAPAGRVAGPTRLAIAARRSMEGSGSGTRYTGWLGDYGPPHTHTVREMEGEVEAGEEGDDEDEGGDDGYVYDVEGGSEGVRKVRGTGGGHRSSMHDGKDEGMRRDGGEGPTVTIRRQGHYHRREEGVSEDEKDDGYDEGDGDDVFSLDAGAAAEAARLGAPGGRGRGVSSTMATASHATTAMMTAAGVAGSDGPHEPARSAEAVALSPQASSAAVTDNSSELAARRRNLSPAAGVTSDDPIGGGDSGSSGDGDSRGTPSSPSRHYGIPDNLDGIEPAESVLRPIDGGLDAFLEREGGRRSEGGRWEAGGASSGDGSGSGAYSGGAGGVYIGAHSGDGRGGGSPGGYTGGTSGSWWEEDRSAIEEEGQEAGEGGGGRD